MTATWSSRFRLSLGRRHSVPVEAAAFGALYAAYETLRGIVAGDAQLAVRHGQAIADLERRLHILVEPNVAHGAAAVPRLLVACSIVYLVVHFGVTTAVLAWL